MKRLTPKGLGKTIPIPINKTTLFVAYAMRLAELEDKLESGHLVELPCNSESKLFVICSCKDIEMIRDDGYETGTGAVECPFENQCEREDCENENHLQVFETCMGYVWFDNEENKLRAKAEHTNIEIKIGKNAFYTKSQAEARLKELQEK